MTIVQTSAEGSISSGTSGTVSLAGTNAGNKLVLLFICATTAGGTPTSVNDGTNNYTQDAGQGSSSITGTCCVFSLDNIAGGNTTVTVTVPSSTCKFRLYEVSGLPTSASLCGRDQKVESANGTAHQMAGMSGVNSVTDCVIFCCGIGSANAGGFTGGTGFAVDTSAATGTLYEHGVFTGAQAANLGAVTSANSIKMQGVMVAYQKAVAASTTYVIQQQQTFLVESEDW